jgi:hypothetical protein
MKRSENHRVTLTILNPIEWYATMGLCTDKLQLDHSLVTILGFRLAGLAVLDDGSLQAKTKNFHVCSEIEVIYWHGKSQLFFCWLEQVAIFCVPLQGTHSMLPHLLATLLQ